MKPTFVGTVWQLMLLGDMGFNVSDPRIAKACEYALEFQAPLEDLVDTRVTSKGVDTMQIHATRQYTFLDLEV